MQQVNHREDDVLTDTGAQRVTISTIMGLAVPALGVLLTTPIFVLLDTAIVGRLGGIALAALAAGSTIYSMFSAQLTFLSYGTTARSARLYGAGDRRGAITEGVQATWIALFVGTGLCMVIFFNAEQLCAWMSTQPDIAQRAAGWLKITAFAIPLVLIDMAGNGWLRGIQNTRLPLLFTLAGVIPAAVLIPIFVHKWGLYGSAWATLLATAITALCFLGCLIHHHQGSWIPRVSIITHQLVLARDLIIRSLSFQVAFLCAAAVLGRYGATALAAHHILLQLWNFIALFLDSLAIAAQALVGQALGAQSRERARSVAQRVLGFSTFLACILALCCALGHTFIARIFTHDEAVLHVVAHSWWQLIVMTIVGGVVFALDGVLLGAGDAAFLRSISLASVLGGFLPGIALAAILGTGLIGVWWALMAFVFIRFIAVVWRFISMKWAHIDDVTAMNEKSTRGI
ncbi:MATE family efflux transporter [Corynebacterium sp. sy039]|uniref:MATE family efflux transporter n=1 Tax=Corynebacterium sp. sy039 TaxID=2599641 RepID=UPI0011B514F7|nr:MATE family efflux transporter [Corynebacterium sp. sy039]